MSEREYAVSGTVKLVDQTAPAPQPVPPAAPVTQPVPRPVPTPEPEKLQAERASSSPDERPPLLAGVKEMDRATVLALLGALAAGLVLGFFLFHEDPAAELVEARNTIAARDEQAAALTDRVGVLEAELRRANPDAVERAEREAALADRDRTLARREAELAQREQELEGYWRIPKFDLPALQDVQDFFQGVANTASGELNTAESVSEATRPGDTAAP